MARQVPAPIPNPATKAVGLGTDPDVWASGILVLGSGAAKLLSYAEHIDFLISLRGENFKMIFDFWNGAGWWLTIGAGAGWLINRFSKRNIPHEKGPSWGLVISCAVVAFIFGSLLSVQSSGGVPRVITQTATPYQITPEGLRGGTCAVQADGTTVVSFKKDFKLALVCTTADPTTDVLSDTHIVVSSLFEIVPGPLAISANKSPSGDFTVPRGAGGISVTPFVFWSRVILIGKTKRLWQT
jgi:hypothetical protein